MYINTILNYLNKLPLIFEANQGQTSDEVKFLAKAKGYDLYLTLRETAIILKKTKDLGDIESSEEQISDVRLKFINFNTNTKVIGLEKLPGKTNYFIGNDKEKWHKNIPTYKMIKYLDVYPGVDMIYYGNEGYLEWDFIVSAGADPSIICLGIEGSDELLIDEQGNLVLITNDEQIKINKPIIYQDIDNIKKEVSGKFILKDEHQISFEVGVYDSTRSLVIDPVLSFSTYLGGNDNDSAEAIALDSSGNIYITGETSSTNFPTKDPIQGSNAGKDDAFVTKISADGSNIIYSTYIGGSEDDSGNDIAVDSSGNVYITGETFSTNFPTENPIRPALKGTSNAFITKINSDGSNIIYSTFLVGGKNSEGNGICIDYNNNAYVTGSTIGISGGSVNLSKAFIIKIYFTGSSIVYTKLLYGNSTDSGNDIAVDTSGNVYITGSTSSTNFPTKNPIQSELSGSSAAFVTKLNADGVNLVYSTYLGGGYSDTGNAIAVDNTGNGYVTGTTDSTDFPTKDPIQADIGGDEDAFVTKISTNGELVYSTYLGGTMDDNGEDIEVDSSGNVYIIGDTSSTNFPVKDVIQDSNRGLSDVFVTKINDTGSSIVYSTYIGGTGSDYGNSITVDASGNVYASGQTFSNDFLIKNPIQSDKTGLSSAFVFKISESQAQRGLNLSKLYTCYKENKLKIPEQYF